MAEPQANQSTTSEQRNRGESSSSAAAERRSFDQAQRSAAQSTGEMAQSAREGSRQMVEQGRRAGQQVAEAWRGAVDPFLAMQYDMGRWFDEIWRQTFGFRHSPTTHPLRSLATMGPGGIFGLPPADLKETDQEMRLAIELPGLAREDIDISIDGDALVVCGHKAEESQDASATYRVNERRYGRFERIFPLPPEVDRNKIEARFQDGVLKITAPKDPQAAPRRHRIDIQG